MRSASLLAAFCVLISAATVSAECAWVLWNDEARLDCATEAESRAWYPIAGTVRKTECEARLRQEIDPDNRPKGALLKVLGDAVQVVPFRSDKPNEKVAGVQSFRDRRGRAHADATLRAGSKVSGATPRQPEAVSEPATSPRPGTAFAPRTCGITGLLWRSNFSETFGVFPSRLSEPFLL